MADYGVISAVRNMIANAQEIVQLGLSQKVHCAIPPKAEPPLVLIELEEIWTSLKLGKDCGHARLKVKASIIGNTPTQKDSLKIADQIRSQMDGKTIKVDDDMRATIRLSNSIIDLPTKVGHKSVQQYYEVLVRG